MNIAVLSDTHGLLRPEVLPHLEGVDAILHAGDVGNPQILERLATFGPVYAIRGNVDRSPELLTLPETLLFELGGVSIFMLHDLKALDKVQDGVRIVVSGHSHQPRIVDEGGVLHLNPGSCGSKRFSLPVSLARLELGAALRASLISL
jgi:uncharacterized protein